MEKRQHRETKLACLIFPFFGHVWLVDKCKRSHATLLPSVIDSKFATANKLLETYLWSLFSKEVAICDS